MDLKNETKGQSKKDKLKKKWLLTSGASLALFSAGLCIFAEAAFLKHDGASFTQWFGLGFISLILINAGLSIFGNAINQKSYMDSRKRLKRRRDFSNRRNYNRKKKQNNAPSNS